MRTKTTINGPNINTVQKKKRCWTRQSTQPMQEGIAAPIYDDVGSKRKVEESSIMEEPGFESKKRFKVAEGTKK